MGSGRTAPVGTDHHPVSSKVVVADGVSPDDESGVRPDAMAVGEEPL